MTDSKKKRMSMLDSFAAAGASPAASMMTTNRALRSARDAVDGHNLWELDPAQIVDDRMADRLDPADVAELRASIEANGQSVPILVRRDPRDVNRYLLVYGRRRLEAIKGSEQVHKVRALVASLDDGAAIRAQVAENTGRRDLSFIERALFARSLVEAEFGTQAQVAEALNATKSAISMALSVVATVGPDLARAIGPAQGVGRPRWEALAHDITAAGLAPATLTDVALAARADSPEGIDSSVAAFDAVTRALKKALKTPRTSVAGAPETGRALLLEGRPAGKVERVKSGVRMDIRVFDQEFADWLEAEAQTLLNELHARWKAGV
jgi:ParB family chromosome partitioning protein